MSTKRSVALCVTGSIAAYKAAEIARGLVQAGLRVIPIMTGRAEAFVGTATLSGITGEPVRTSMWDPSFAGEMHVAIAKECDALVIAPATADLIARLAEGRADDLVTAIALVTTRPCLLAPAMHPAMWSHPATQRNVAQLQADGRIERVGPVDGPVASGESGMGRMAEPAHIVEATLSILREKDLAATHIVVTAGPTLEDLDPVRFLSNRSSGKMGFAIARCAAARGARVTLITGPGDLPTPHRVDRVAVRSALSMRDALWGALGADLSAAEVLIMSAAVSDYRPLEQHGAKQKRREDSLQLNLVANPDLLAEIGKARSTPHPILIGFAVETGSDEQIIAYAQRKLAEKGADLIVANRADEAFGQDNNRAFFVHAAGVDPQPLMLKDQLADRILNRICDLLKLAALNPWPLFPQGEKGNFLSETPLFPRGRGGGDEGGEGLEMEDTPGMLIPPLVVVLIAGALSIACSPSQAARPGALVALLIPYLALSIFALWRMSHDGTLRERLRWRSGDVTRGALMTIGLGLAIFVGRQVIAPLGSARENWTVRLYLQLGEIPKDRAQHFLMAAGIVLIALAEEVVWRGLVQQILEERWGTRRGWLGTAGLYSLAHAPTLWLLQMPGAGKNPLLVLASLFCGLVWGFWVGRTQRLTPVLISHALFTYAFALELRLWK